MITKEIHDRVIARIDECLKKASIVYDREFEAPTVTYKEMANANGRIKLKEKVMILDPNILCNNVDDFIHQTVAHEIAHLIDFVVGGLRIRGHRRNGTPIYDFHGKHWKRVMNILGVNPERTTSYKNSVPTKTGGYKRKHVYVCQCQTHYVTTRKHNNIQIGIRTYRCTACKTPVEYKGIL